MSVGGVLFLSYLIISYIAGALISMTIILENRDPAKTMTWLLIFILLPYIFLIIVKQSKGWLSRKHPPPMTIQLHPLCLQELRKSIELNKFNLDTYIIQ